MERPVVTVVTTPARPIDMATVGRHLGDIATIQTLDFADRPHSPAEEAAIVSQLSGSQAVFMRSGYLNASMLEKLPSLRIIALHGAGLNQVDLVAASQRGIVVTNAPGGNATAVAEYTFGLLLALLRGIVRADALVRSDRWNEAIFNGRQLHSKVLGIVGFGNIGTRIAKIGNGFSMKVIAYDPFVADEKFRDAMVDRRELLDLLSEADIITLHLSLSDDTRHLISRKEFNLLKDGAVLVNAARGQLVDEAALVDALASGRLAGAAIDAFAEEPVSQSSPLLRFENVVVSPHMAGVAQEVITPIADMAAADIASVLEERAPRYIVNADLLKQFGQSNT